MKKDIPTVSIGMPVFNGGKFLRRALDSLLAQSYTNFELIISDNASTDETEKICREYAFQDDRIKYIRQVNNSGSHRNFNFVLQESRGEYFMWAADDDQWDQEYVQTMVIALQKDPSAVGAYTPYQFIEEEKKEFYGNVWKPNYTSDYAIFRLIKFSWHYDDKCIYGLMRKKYLDDDQFIKFKPWGWINANTPYNIAYPMLYFMLSKGNLLLIGEKPLWIKSATTKPRHNTPSLSNPVFGYFAHIVRKINLVFRSIHYIHLASKSVLLVLLTMPFLLARFLYDCVTPIYAAIYIWASGKKISQLSPHEIWRLGVR